MTRTGARAAALAELLDSAGFRTVARPASPRLENLRSEVADAVLEVYHTLGGRHTEPVLRPGPWDLAVAKGADTLLVELDEDLHFNRYREATLTAPWYRSCNWAAEYIRQCRVYERHCTQAGDWGKRWTTGGSEQLFGAPGPAGQVAGVGSPRWKQRALYDAIKDVAAANGDTAPLARLSVHDRIQERTLESWLIQPRDLDRNGLCEFIASRVTTYSGA